MIRLHLVFVGKTAFPEVEQAVQRYLDRLRHYISVELHLVRPEKVGDRGQDERVRDREGERILKLVGARDVLVALDRQGSQLDSEGLASCIHEIGRQGKSDIWLAIGGPVGLSRQVLERADRILALSRI